MGRRRNEDLHGNAPDASPVALLIVDAINDLEFEGGAGMLPRATRMARAIARLKRRSALAGIPTIYVLFTAADAYMRDFRVIVPRDCATALTPAAHRSALGYMHRTLKARVAASASIDVKRLTARS